MMLSRKKTKELEMISKNRFAICFIDSLCEEYQLSRSKYNDGIEYEVKLDCENYLSIFEINRLVSIALSKSHYYPIHCEIYAKFDIDFFLEAEHEYSRFIYEGETLLKKKNHSTIIYDGIPIMKSSEQFECNKDIMDTILCKQGVQFVGKMVKERVKDFIVNETSGMIFSSATTLCTVSDEVQLQCELEYFGHYTNHKTLVIGEDSILSELSKLGKILLGEKEMCFSTSIKTKMDFLQENSIIGAH